MPFTAQEILAKIKEAPNASISVKDLLKSLRLSKHDRKEIKRLLRGMVHHGEIVRRRGGRYSLPPKSASVSGTFSAHPDGYGFVVPDTEDQGDIYISPRATKDAMDGDHVLAQVHAVKADGRREGMIIQVLDRGRRQVVGRFERGAGRTGGAGFVIPQNPKIHHDISVDRHDDLGAQDGDMVVAELLSYPTPKRSPRGKITRILGVAGDPAIDTEIIIEDLSLPRTFPENCHTAAQGVPDRVEVRAMPGRRDLRGLRTVTIDGEQARDFDDAVSIQLLANSPAPARGGGSGAEQFRLWVHIADVAHYVPWGTILDLEARRRGNSVYFPDRVIPMFPERLSNGICSLNPREDRLTITAEMLFDGDGNRLEYDLYESVIRSDERMTYTEVNEILTANSPGLQERYAPLLRQFGWMKQLCEILRARRMERGSIDFDLPEPEIILDVQGQTMQILKQERNIAHRIIEEFMLAANEAVAEHLEGLEVPMIYRIHEEPDPDKMMDLNALLEGFGLYLRGVAQVRPKTLQKVLEEVRGRPEEKLINTVLLRSMKQARYACTPAGHFGLAARCYTHFTSPIRRYPDLVIHRLLKETWTRPPRSHPAGRSAQLCEIARHSSERERLAMDAERKVVEMKKVRFMADKIGQVYPGHISGVLPFGFFVELDEIFVEGLVPRASLADDRYIYHEAEHSLVGAGRRRRFRLGDPLGVRVERVDLVRQRIDFSLDEPTRSVRIAAGRGSSVRRRGGPGTKKRRT